MENGPGKFYVTVIGSKKYGHLPRRVPVHGHSPEELSKSLNKLAYVNELCINSNQFFGLAPDEREKQLVVIREFLEKSFTTEVNVYDSSTDNELKLKNYLKDLIFKNEINKTKELIKHVPIIQKLLEINHASRARKLKITWAAIFVGTIINTSLLFSSLPAQLLCLALTLPAFWIIDNAFNNISRNSYWLNMMVILPISAILLYSGTAGLYPTLLFGVGGFLLNYFRDREMKYSLTQYHKYYVPDLKPTNDEISSLTAGLEAKKVNSLFAPIYWGDLSTWKCPRAYLAGLNCTSEEVDKLKERMKFSH